MLKLTDYVFLGILMLLIAALIIKTVRQDEDRRTHYVLLFLRLVAREAPEDQVATLRKLVYLRMPPAVGFTISGLGVDSVRVDRVELEADDNPGVRDKTVSCVVHLEECKIEGDRLAAVSQNLQDTLGWEYLGFMSTDLKPVRTPPAS